MKDYKDVYAEYLGLIEKRLEDYVKVTEPVSLYEPFKYIISAGGKRIRPVLTMFCAGAAGGNPIDAVDAGAAIEILHNFTLVHDDIMDSSPMRRGKQTVHEKWNTEIGILTGDVMVGHAYRLLPGPKAHARSGEIHAAFTRGLIEVCEGQAYDALFDSNDNVGIDDYLMMIDKKTAKMLETAALIGGHTGNGSAKDIEALRLYAYNVGLAFQIQDDLLDLTAEQAQLGKRIGQDVIEGKKTLLILKAKEKARSENDKELLDKFYREHGLSEEYISAIREMFDRLGVLTAASDEADKYFIAAEAELGKLKKNDSVEALYWLIKKLNKRKF